MRIRILDARTHMPEQYQEFFEGYKALQLIDEAECLHGEMVWRLATILPGFYHYCDAAFYVRDMEHGR